MRSVSQDVYGLNACRMKGDHIDEDRVLLVPGA